MRTRGSTIRRLISGFMLMMLCMAPSAFAANTMTDDFFPNTVLLTPDSQLGQVWTNTIPNALASYYTYIPLSNADAVAVGFPGACGHPVEVRNPLTTTLIHSPAQGDLDSTADCYIISVREFKQPMSLEFLKFVLPEWPGSLNSGLNLFPGKGLLSSNGTTPFVNQTDVNTFLATKAAGTVSWGYGSGGKNWKPYGASGPAIRGNAPWAFQMVPFNYLFGVAPTGDQNNSPGLEALGSATVNGTGIWHFPAPTIKGQGKTHGAASGQRPVYVQWLNDLPNSMPPGHDPSVDCGANALNCYPYNRQVVHVHGAHVGPESDGLATSWYTPNFALFGEGKFTSQENFYNAPNGTAAAIGPIHYYPMDQEAGTIWYHDHAIGTTHLNTNQGMAGFFPVTDTNEKCLQGIGNGCSVKLPTGDFELGFALQDRHFDNSGQMVMPNYAIYDKTIGSCVELASGVPDPAVCTRVQFLKKADTSVNGFHFIPDTPANRTEVNFGTGLNPTSGCNANPNGPYEITNQCAPFGATSATLEYMGIMPVVNGVTYGKYPVSPGVYRMRFIGGTDSRTWLLQLQYGAGAAAGTGTVIPFYQIGSEQGLLNQPVSRNMIDLMGGERVDVLVDFNSLPKYQVGHADEGKIIPVTVYLKNLGDDAPYAGQFAIDANTVLPLDPLGSNSIPDVMVFDVAMGAVNNNSPAPSSLGANSLRTGNVALPSLVAPQYVRNISLVEITDAYGRTMPTIDARGYRPNEVPITENILLNQIERWDIVNTTVDAHPMHLHQVAFQLVNRELIADFSAPVDPTVFTSAFPLPPANGYTEHSPVYAPAQYIGSGTVIPPQDYETLAMKDTIDCPPGYVTRVLTKFDILGTYVWHCHILSHEEHDMMRPFRVVADPLVKPAWFSVPATTDANGKAYVLAATNSVPGVQYVVQYRKKGQVPAHLWHTNHSSVRNPTVDLRIDPAKPETAELGPGTYEFRVQVVNQILQGSAATNYADSGWTSGSNDVVYSNQAAAPPWISVPANAAADGKAYIIAGASGTPGVQYKFEYSTDGSTWTAFPGQPGIRNQTVQFPGAGSYFVHVIAVDPGAVYTPSLPKQAGNQITVAALQAAASPWFSVPAAATAGRTVYVLAGTSPTTGARYNFQYKLSTDGTWTDALMNSVNRNTTITLPNVAGTYNIRTYVTATGYSQSNVMSGNTVLGGIAAATPPWISVPATTTTGNIYVLAGTSATPGVQYVFEYSTDGTNWTLFPDQIGIRTPTLTLPATGTYTLRVTAFDPSIPQVFNDSVPRVSTTVTW